MATDHDALWTIRQALAAEGRLPGGRALSPRAASGAAGSERVASERIPLDQSQLDEIAWRMLRAGVQPTVEGIRAIYGSGSPNRLHPMLRRFYAGLATRLQLAPLADEVPAPLRQLWLQALDLASDAVRERHDAQAEALRKRVAELEQREALLERKLKRLRRVRADGAAE
ncbi:DNA-binding protein [Lysobacter enzymogenes]|uniref:DNA-binding protein n=1 Tax=Lysobacter enzymogenes TaxID=69 RepID=UPI0008962CE8|nr:DNA-binding protein [Lysobacter enzymogenes]SDW92069.1 replication region DNA-binding N-term [Lysobacter enzymogenes]